MRYMSLNKHFRTGLGIVKENGLPKFYGMSIIAGHGSEQVIAHANLRKDQVRQLIEDLENDAVFHAVYHFGNHEVSFHASRLTIKIRNDEKNTMLVLTNTVTRRWLRELNEVLNIMEGLDVLAV